MIKAIILVGGKATRLEPLTINTPKALIPVMNVPFLEYVIRNLARYQIQEIVLALGNLAEPIMDNLGDGSRFGVRLYYSVESKPLGSAGAVKNAERFFDETFLVLNGDVFSDLNIKEMIEYHRDRKSMATIAVTPVDDPTSFGLVDTDERGRVTRFLEKPKPEEVTTNMINAGAWLVEPEVMSRVPPETWFSFERNVFPALLADGEPVYAYTSTGYWMDTGNPEKYLQLHRDLFGGKSGWYVPTKKLLVGEQTDIHPEVRITGLVILGANCTIRRGVKLIGPVVIGNGCTLLEDTVIENSVIWRNARLGPRVNLKNCVVADNCCINPDCVCEGTVLGDNVTVTRGCRLKPGCKIGPGEIVELE